MRQHALQSALNPISRSPSPEPLTHVKEQEILRSETIAAFHTAVTDDGDEEEDDLLVLREKTKDEVEHEEEEYREFLQREVGEDLGELIRVDADEGGLGRAKDEVEEAEAGTTEKKRKRKKEKNKGKDVTAKSKEQEDQEFLMK